MLKNNFNNTTNTYQINYIHINQRKLFNIFKLFS